MSELPKIKILNVDDYEPGLYAKSRALKLANFEVIEATTGEEALRKTEELKPHLVLLDVRLPDLNGIEVCHRLKTNPTTSSIPVIQTSATFLESHDRIRGLDGGADAYLTEPVEADELIANVRAMLRLRQAENAVREREAWLSTTLRSIGDAVIATDLEGRVTLINPVAQALVGWTQEEAKGRLLSEVFRTVNEHTRQPCDNPGMRVLRDGATSGLAKDSVLLSRDGREMQIDDRAAGIKNERGDLIGVVLIFRDVTERRLAEKEREQLLRREQEARREAEVARQRAEEVSRLKDEFLAMISHELRTPLNHMLGWVTMLLGGELKPQQAQNALETIERNVRAQNRLIEDLLDVSRIIAGKIRIESRSLMIARVVEAAVESARPAAMAKGVHIQTAVDSQAGFVSGDSDRLQQAVGNLLANAIKFTAKDGQVRVRLARLDSQVEITVSDDGQGISPDFLPHVFDRFRQEDATISRKHGGLGLGLAIVRNLVELHGGSVRAESPGEGLGASFSIILPLAAGAPLAVEKRVAAAPAQAEAGLPTLEGVRVLLVDDVADSREMVSLMLVKSGAEVKTVGSAAEAFSTLGAWRPDVILSDIGMPDEDGYSFIRRVRQLGPAQGGDIPAISVTAYAGSKDRLRALTAGYQAHVAKPVERAELVAVVATLTRGALKS
jgi:PAS domain S-box-containing protein